jgi:AAHS family 4-hydroxybenzoate transporter-like MFS transporter
MLDQISNFRATLDRHPVSGFQWRLLLLLTLLLVTDGYDALGLGYVVPALAQEWNVDKVLFGPVFSANLLGLTLGSLLVTPLADRIGIRPVLLGCILTYALLTLLTTQVDSIQGLVWVRFICGIGMGGAMPCAMALMSEYSPPRQRTLMVTLAACGFSLGGAMGGFVAAALIERFGWQAVFLTGGVAPLILLPALILFLPESLPKLLTDGEPFVRLRKLTQRMKLDWQPVQESEAQMVATQPPSRLAVIELFRNGYARPTLLIWATFFMALILLYFMVSWLPTLLKQNGVTLSEANLITSLFLFAGTVGAGGMSYFADRVANKARLLSVVLAAAALFTTLIGLFHDHKVVMIGLVFAAGMCVIGGQLTLNAFSSNFYPAHCRTTGAGWALGVGRFGSILGPLFGSLFIGMQLPVSQIFILSAIPAILAALFISQVKSPTLKDGAQKWKSLMKESSPL